MSGRNLVLRQNRRILFSAIGSRLWLYGEVRPKLRRKRRASENSQESETEESHVRLECRRCHPRYGVLVPEGRCIQSHRSAFNKLRVVVVRQSFEGRKDGRVIDVQQLQLQ